MGQIVKRKKKGRPAKADPGGRGLQQTERDLRRSHRRRNVKYVFDLDDYFDEDEVFADDDEDQRRREKKLKLLLQLQSGGDAESTSPRDLSPASSSDDGGKPSKKRRINEDLDVENEEDNYNYEDDEEVIDSQLIASIWKWKLGENCQSNFSEENRV